MSVLDAKIPEGPIKDKWTNHKNNIKGENIAEKNGVNKKPGKSILTRLHNEK